MNVNLEHNLEEISDVSEELNPGGTERGKMGLVSGMILVILYPTELQTCPETALKCTESIHPAHL